MSMSVKTKLDMNKRFWSKINAAKECWIWWGARDTNGYGRIRLYNKDGSIIGDFGTHRVMFELHHGRKIKEGYMICHTCDNSLCVNPDHLYEGTAYDNIMDAVKRGRHKPFDATGTKHSNESKEKMRTAKKAEWANRTPEQRKAINEKRMKTRYGK